MKKERHDVKSSIEPTISPNAEVLILGSVPGEDTIKARIKNNNDEYYSNKNNKFWDIIAEKYNLEPDLKLKNYEHKKNILVTHKIALWDIISHCTRIGSSDATIANPEYNNDIAGCLKQNKSIKRIILNGKNKDQWFNEYKNYNNVSIDIEVVPLYCTSTYKNNPMSSKEKQMWIKYLPD